LGCLPYFLWFLSFWSGSWVFGATLWCRTPPSVYDSLGGFGPVFGTPPVFRSTGVDVFFGHFYHPPVYLHLHNRGSSFLLVGREVVIGPLQFGWQHLHLLPPSWCLVVLRLFCCFLTAIPYSHSRLACGGFKYSLLPHFCPPSLQNKQTVPSLFHRTTVTPCHQTILSPFSFFPRRFPCLIPLPPAF